MSRWVWSIVVMGSAVAAFVADRLVWPGHDAVDLYAIPLLLASVRWPPEAVLVLTAGCLVVAIYDLYLTGQTTPYSAVSLAVLLAVGLLTRAHALHRQELLRKLQRQQAVIDTVQRLRQPLAVILGYTQLLEASPPSETRLSQALGAIRRAAVDLREMLDEIIARWGTA